MPAFWKVTGQEAKGWRGAIFKWEKKEVGRVTPAQDGDSFFRLVRSRMGQDLEQGGLRKVPREDETKETEVRKNESTEEPPCPEPEKMGHSSCVTLPVSSSCVTEAHGIPHGF